MSERVGFEEKKTIDMKIYQVPSDVAKWFKKWCDQQGLRFNQGMVLLKHVVEDYERFRKMENVVEENRNLIMELYNKLGGNHSEENKPNENQQDSSVEKQKQESDKPKTFGRKR